MTVRVSRAAAALSAALLSGCIATPPAPVDQYYRLRADQGPALPGATAALGVGEFRAEGLLRERSLVYSDDGGQRVLKQHAYHHWVDTPQRMVRDYWTQRLAVTEGERAFTVHGRILRMERLLEAGRDAVALSLRLRLRARGQVGDILQREYTAIRASDSGEVLDSVKAYEAAMDEIIGRFLTDLDALAPLAQGLD